MNGNFALWLMVIAPRSVALKICSYHTYYHPLLPRAQGDVYLGYHFVTVLQMGTFKCIQVLILSLQLTPEDFSISSLKRKEYNKLLCYHVCFVNGFLSFGLSYDWNLKYVNLLPWIAYGNDNFHLLWDAHCFWINFGSVHYFAYHISLIHCLGISSLSSNKWWFWNLMQWRGMMPLLDQEPPWLWLVSALLKGTLVQEVHSASTAYLFHHVPSKGCTAAPAVMRRIIARDSELGIFGAEKYSLVSEV